MEMVTEDKRDTRCECGQLLAKIVSAGVELKCKRCKRINVIPWSEMERS